MFQRHGSIVGKSTGEVTVQQEYRRYTFLANCAATRFALSRLRVGDRVRITGTGIRAGKRIVHPHINRIEVSYAGR